MFTGIITATGKVASAQPLGASAAHGLRLTVETPTGYLDDVALGDSIAIDGACMTVALAETQTAPHRFSVDVSAESLACTTGLDRPGRAVNLEKALRAGDRLGGHMVAGHVDGIGQVLAFEPVGESWLLRVRAPAALAGYLARKGSVALNGVSLTLNSVRDESAGCAIEINLIPHTVENTALRHLRTNDAVNLEVDLIARYVERIQATQARTA